MKYEISFAEMAEIFKAVAKIDEMKIIFDEKKVEWEVMRNEFDRIFEEENRIDSDLLDAKIAARNAFEKIEKRIYKVIAETAEKMNLNQYEYRDNEILASCKERSHLIRTITFLKSMVMEQVKYLPC